MTDWFARPVLHVSNVEASLRFYVDRLGFTIPWQFEGVAQVDRDGCALILSEHWPEKVGKGLMFISLNVEPETKEAYVAALDALRAELQARGAEPRRLVDPSLPHRPREPMTSSGSEEDTEAKDSAVDNLAKVMKSVSSVGFVH